MKKILLCVFILLMCISFLACGNDIKQLTKAAKNGDAEAQYQLGYSCFYGTGTSQNYEEAIKWFELSAEQGNAESQFKLGEIYYFGVGIAQNYNKAVYWLEKAAEQGLADAQFDLGLCYYVGNGVPEDDKLAYMWIYLGLAQINDNEITKNHAETLKLIRTITSSEIAEEWMERHR